MLQKENTLTERETLAGWISNIQRFSVHDGPGIRTLIFVQGCPLRCKWCCNPEGQRAGSQLSYIPTKCVGPIVCGAPCVRVCPTGASTISEAGKLNIDRNPCINCGKCAQACLHGARTMIGALMTVDEVLSEIEKDRTAYRVSGGGVSIGGGEPLAQPEFVLELLKRCKERFLHTVVETCGHAAWRNLRKVCQYIDLLYYDIKHMDTIIHKELTGVSNELILGNARKVLSGKVPCDVIIRTEVIPGCNDSIENIESTARFVFESGGKMMELLPYHRLGSGKYAQLGMEYELADIEPPSDEHMQQLRNIVKSAGLKEMTGKL